MDINKTYLGDCLEVMKTIPDKSIDMVLCDLPYGTTRILWDKIIPYDQLWLNYERVIKDTGAILLFSSQPFTTDLINSNRKLFRYEIIWNKLHGTDFQLANKKPMKSHENILVFYKSLPTYNPQKSKRDSPINTNNWKQNKRNKEHNNFSCHENFKGIYSEKFPTTIIEYSMVNKECNNSKRLHPTQKPVALLEYLIKTYSNEGDLVLDNAMGSGSTIIAAINTKRNWIGIEKDERIFKIADDRINKHLKNNDWF